MNLFISGWGLDSDRCRAAITALKQTARSYPSLKDGGFFSWQSDCNRVVLACQFPSTDFLGSRQYVSDTDQAVVIYDGLPVDGDDRFAAHHAGELARNWDDSVENLDGFFCGVRILKKELQLALQLDSFGVYPVFYWTNGSSWLISNSVAVLDRVTGDRELDPSGVSRFLAMGWVAGDRTLRKGVRTFPAGEQWTWSKDRSTPTNRPTVQRGEMIRESKTKLTHSQVVALGNDMARPLVSLGRNFKNVLCPLTGGKDSRVLAALLAHNDVSARYYTYGNKVGRDAEIAQQIASALGIDHETLVTESPGLLSGWDETVRKFVTHGDGMCPLQLIMGAVAAGDVATRPIPVRIWGAGGELARAMYFNPVHDVRGTTIQDVQDNIARRWIDSSNGMIRPEVCSQARSFIDDAVVKYADDGFPVDDLNDVFFLYDRGARRAGKNMRATMSLRDTYSPFFSRSFVEAVFSQSVRSRRTEVLHYRLIEEFAPEALAIPFDKGAWSRRSPSLNLYLELSAQVKRRLNSEIATRISGTKQESQHILVKDTMFKRVTWLQQIQEKLREMCLDGRSSPVWDYVDRDRFDAVTSTSASGSSLSENAKALFLTATLFYYESHSRVSDVVGSEFDES